MFGVKPAVTSVHAAEPGEVLMQQQVLQQERDLASAAASSLQDSVFSGLLALLWIAGEH